MAHVENPRKQFQFTIIIPGLNPFLAQEVKLPDDESDTAEHGDAGYLVKTAGMRKFGKLTINKICPATQTDRFMRNWRRDILNTNLGGGQLPSQYKKPIMVQEYSSDGITVIDTNIYEGGWPQKINGRDLNRKGSDNTVESIDLEIDRPVE